MKTRFYLMKFAKQSNIDDLTISQLEDLQDIYKNYLKENKGVDPEFIIPGIASYNGKSKR